MPDFLSHFFDTEKLRSQFRQARPFNHVVIDNFFSDVVAGQLNREFPEFDSPQWYRYENAIENKRAMNAWDIFPATTYRAFSYLNSPSFIEMLEKMTGIHGLLPDVGLHGGGWHAHSAGGKLNIHLDYAIHPKLNLERRLNLIVYLTEDWLPSWGGGLQLWSHDEKYRAPKKCEVTIDNVFNRAVLFDTTQNSWHGLPDPLECPEGKVRRSIAVYYLTQPDRMIHRPKALFAPHKGQKDDKSVLELIDKRSGLTSARDVYRTPKK
jgi:Rps23 Pro-64 3,4-dihydroxylase Tpa1-like proline 4-hydroxylase